MTELRKALKKLKQLFGQVLVCYEASGCGHLCQIIAPSLIPTKPGDRRKCDKLDARRLAQYFEAGLLTPIHIPTAEQDAAQVLADQGMNLGMSDDSVCQLGRQVFADAGKAKNMARLRRPPRTFKTKFTEK